MCLYLLLNVANVSISERVIAGGVAPGIWECAVNDAANARRGVMWYDKPGRALTRPDSD
ncbi:hypothetical protein KDA_52720 [Dictyobacter alpinus]|uniref:Uncharacterized protein n=1 Tax=Dictyobacter alpinus TaxID=2014873 RepID=A0A402BEG4_9CHLR|nr:hypothetical protein [Dictyobacter alpinus]GCE29788.1 hypothetical protein KDA_52720 [Dictyobacter alpinus]